MDVRLEVSIQMQLLLYKRASLLSLQTLGHAAQHDKVCLVSDWSSLLASI